ncbi:MAG: AhpC/TSA family protein [Bacteroidetes bacterium]|nr:AhpC/TSA family protein [Bacteroidota bacterium]
MNKFAFWIITGILPVALFAQDANNFSIMGEVKDGHIRKVYLSYFGSHGIRTDSATVEGHVYRLTGKISNGMVVSLSSTGPDDLPAPDQLVGLYLQPSENIRVTHGWSFSDAAISGSPVNAEYSKLMGMMKDYKAKRAGQSGEREDVYGRYMRENPNSPLLEYALSCYLGDMKWITAKDVEGVRGYLGLLPDSQRNTAFARTVTELLDKKTTFETSVAVGRPAPDFTQNDTAGRPVTLSSYRGKWVLVDFWASWCGPCRQDNPNVVAVYRKYHPNGFEIIGVSLDQSETSWKKAIRDDKLAWAQVSDLKYWNNALVKEYGIQGVPQNFLIDPRGVIIAKGLRGADLEKKLSEIYKNQLK